jgi:hypothetical protein
MALPRGVNAAAAPLDGAEPSGRQVPRFTVGHVMRRAETERIDGPIAPLDRADRAGPVARRHPVLTLGRPVVGVEVEPENVDEPFEPRPKWPSEPELVIRDGALVGPDGIGDLSLRQPSRKAAVAQDAAEENKLLLLIGHDASLLSDVRADNGIATIAVSPPQRLRISGSRQDTVLTGTKRSGANRHLGR